MGEGEGVGLEGLEWVLEGGVEGSFWFIFWGRMVLDRVVLRKADVRGGRFWNM